MFYETYKTLGNQNLHTVFDYESEWAHGKKFTEAGTHWYQDDIQIKDCFLGSLLQKKWQKMRIF